MKQNQTLTREAYQNKVRGCWLGKGIGGNLGMPYEGSPKRLALTLENLSSEAVPNDDLELQLLWIKVLEEHGASVRAKELAEASLIYTCYPDEYGVSKWNLNRGILPPLSGKHNNGFGDGMGAAIRSEIWACLFPGDPKRAVDYAREDAIIDHHGNGVWAEQFLAAAESLAFVSSSAAEAIEGGLKFIPSDCRLAKALGLVRSMHAEQRPWEETYDVFMKTYRSPNFTDVSMNLAFIVLGLLYGEGDFEKSLLLAVNCGMDTDCTAATAGAFLGILLGEEGIPRNWKAAAAHHLALSEPLQGLGLPESVDEVTERTLVLHDRLKEEWKTPQKIGFTPEVEDDLDDNNQWLVFRSAGDVPDALMPPAVEEAQTHPEKFQDHMVSAKEIHLPLDSHIDVQGDALHFLTWITTPEDVDAYLMICAEAGITAWLDGKMILNYHGRLPPVPALHRTDGGGIVPATFRAGTPQLLHIRLIGCACPLTLTVALGREDSSYIDGVLYRAGV